MNTSWAIQIRVVIYVYNPGSVVNVPSSQKEAELGRWAGPRAGLGRGYCRYRTASTTLLAHINTILKKFKLTVALTAVYLSGHFVMAPFWCVETWFNNAHFDTTRQNNNVSRRVTDSWRVAISGSIEDVLNHITFIDLYGNYKGFPRFSKGKQSIYIQATVCYLTYLLNTLTLLAPTQLADNLFHSFTVLCENENVLIHSFFVIVIPLVILSSLTEK